MKNKIVLLTLTLIIFTSCNIVKTITNISRLQFKIGEVQNFTVAGISVSNKNKMSDFNTIDALKLSRAVLQKKLLANFVLTVKVKNPGEKNSADFSSAIELKSFPWTLYIDDVETISGNISSPITVPGSGDAKILSLNMGLDLVKFFNDKGYKGLINLALKLGGKHGDPSNIKLKAQPIISSMLGDFQYPEKITILNTSFN